jgi:hypothetical protein
VTGVRICAAEGCTTDVPAGHRLCLDHAAALVARRTELAKAVQAASTTEAASTTDARRPRTKSAKKRERLRRRGARLAALGLPFPVGSETTTAARNRAQVLRQGARRDVPPVSS